MKKKLAKLSGETTAAIIRIFYSGLWMSLGATLVILGLIIYLMGS